MSSRVRVRAKRARRSGRVACGHYIPVGSPIIDRDGRWMCRGCALETVRRVIWPDSSSDDGEHERRR
jgi:hypothetical protein